MISFHPLPKFKSLLKCIFKPTQDTSIERFFPHNTTHLVDSGTSAFALIIEELNLINSRIALPAFLCDDLTDVLKHYHITPYFLDIDPDTFQPTAEAYQAIAPKIDALYLVATYGDPVSDEIYNAIDTDKVIVIEDRAHCTLPQEPTAIQAHACLYSLPKTSATPDGGIAVVPKNGIRTFPHSGISVGYIRNAIKLIRPFNTLLTKIKKNVNISVGSTWEKIREPHRLSINLLGAYLEKRTHADFVPKYCYPFYTRDPQRAKELLIKNGITAQRIWNRPIALSYETDLQNYPHTQNAAESIICAPGWHIRSKDEEERYVRKLENILSDNLTQVRSQWRGNERPQTPKG